MPSRSGTAAAGGSGSALGQLTVAPSSSAAAPHEATTEATTARLAAVTVGRAGSTAATRAVSAAATSCGVVDGGALTAAVGAVVVGVEVAVGPSMTWTGTPADVSLERRTSAWVWWMVASRLTVSFGLGTRPAAWASAVVRRTRSTSTASSGTDFR